MNKLKSSIKLGAVNYVYRKCAPSAANDRPVTPEDAAFRALLEGKDRSRAALEKAIANNVSSKKD